MPGPAPKHPSVRARRNDPRKGFRALTGGISGEKPSWPLPAMPRAAALVQFLTDKVALLNAELDHTDDGRTRGRLRKQIDAASRELLETQWQLEQQLDAEKQLWDELWEMPQAEIWQETHAVREVAQYARWKVMAEGGDLKAATEARLLSDRLGLNPMALMRLHLEIEHVNAAEDRGARRRKPSEKKPDDDKPTDPRGILRAV